MNNFIIGRYYICTESLFMKNATIPSFIKGKKYKVMTIDNVDGIRLLNENNSEHWIGIPNENNDNGNWWKYFISRKEKLERLLK